MWLWGDSYDHYTDLATKYPYVGTAQAIVAGAGRFGTSAVRFTDANGRVAKGVVPGSATAGAFLTMANRYTPGSAGGNFGFANLWDGAGGRGHVVFVRNTDGSISAWRQHADNAPLQVFGDTLLGTTPPGLLQPSRYDSVELYVKVHATAGTVRIRVNGHEVLTLAGVATKNPTAGSTWSAWYVGLETGTIGNFDVDDLLLYDDYVSGDGVTDFLGDLTGECLVATGVGASSQWTRNTGATNVSCVDETPPDGDTTYVEDGTIGHVDTYTVPALMRITDGIRAVQVVLTANHGGVGARAIAGVIRRSGTNYLGPDVYLGTAYGVAAAAFPLDPAGGAWSAAAVAATEIGQQVKV